jgi:uncharacterized protein (TIGR02231 family)
MKHYPLLSSSVFGGFLALLAVSSLSAAPVQSKIGSVTVYTDRAVVARSATLEIKAPGVVEAEFTSLPTALMDQSLQASGRGTAQATILDLSTKTVHLEAPQNERVKTLEQELQALQRQQQQLDDKEAIVKQQEGYLAKILGSTAAPPAQGQARPAVEEWAKLLSFQQEQLVKYTQQHRELAVEKTALLAKISAAQQNLDELRGDSGRDVKVVVVRLDAASAGSLELKLSYAVPGANWTPGYDARLRVEARQLELAYFGHVRNRTGEDWSGVALTLSTAKPSLGGGVPELSPWIVDVYQPVDKMMVRGSRSDSSMPLASMAPRMRMPEGKSIAFEEAPALSVQQAFATVDSSTTSATFRITAPFTLRSDGSTQKVSIATVKLASKLQFDAVPKLAETAYLNAKVTNSSEYPLLAGAVNTFLDDSFVATSRLKTVMPGEKFDLALGADEGITVKRRLVNRFTENVGLTSKTVRVTYESLVTLTNNKKTAERVVFKEPIPVSRHEQVEVQLLTPAERELSTKESPKDIELEEGGRLVWKVDLKPGEKREFPLKIQVQHPVGASVSGLE